MYKPELNILVEAQLTRVGFRAAGQGRNQKGKLPKQNAIPGFVLLVALLRAK